MSVMVYAGRPKNSTHSPSPSPGTGAQLLHRVPARKVAPQAGDFVERAEHRPDELGRPLADLGGVLPGKPPHVALRGADPARREVLGEPLAIAGRNGIDEAAEESADRVGRAERQEGKRAAEEFQGRARSLLK